MLLLSLPVDRCGRLLPLGASLSSSLACLLPGAFLIARPKVYRALHSASVLARVTASTHPTFHFPHQNIAYVSKYGISEFRWWRLSQCPLRDYKDIMLGVWTAIKTASEVAEEVGWKRVIQRELGVSERMEELRWGWIIWIVFVASALSVRCSSFYSIVFFQLTKILQNDGWNNVLSEELLMVVGGHSSCKGKSNQSSVKYGCSLVKGKANHPMENYHIAKFVHVQRARAWAF
ncbi:hypothetical protein D0Y65_048829 [Glycine soja]|uniref:Uncharacterized protein n=1 Tax=Glycine soja TaxID=3848 RepID=A0A445FUQ0_GLYSO|nr:hypothetical protein D0Y65_048829 [Glycine soja]